MWLSQAQVAAYGCRYCILGRVGVHCDIGGDGTLARCEKFHHEHIVIGTRSAWRDVVWTKKASEVCIVKQCCGQNRTQKKPTLQCRDVDSSNVDEEGLHGIIVAIVTIFRK